MLMLMFILRTQMKKLFRKGIMKAVNLDIDFVVESFIDLELIKSDIEEVLARVNAEIVEVSEFVEDEEDLDNLERVS